MNFGSNARQQTSMDAWQPTLNPSHILRLGQWNYCYPYLLTSYRELEENIWIPGSWAFILKTVSCAETSGNWYTVMKQWRSYYTKHVPLLPLQNPWKWMSQIVASYTILKIVLMTSFQAFRKTPENFCSVKTCVESLCAEALHEPLQMPIENSCFPGPEISSAIQYLAKSCKE